MNTTSLKTSVSPKAIEAAAPEATDVVVNGSVNGSLIAAVRADAREFASQLGDQIIDTLVETIDATETVKRNPLVVMFMLRERFDGTDGRRDLSDCPVPGSKTGNKPDFVEDKEKNEQGEVKTVTTSWWKEVAKATDEGKAIVAALAEVNGKTGRWEVGAEGSATEWRRVSEKKKLDSRLNAFVALVKKAGALHFQFEAIDNLPGVKYEFATDGEGDDMVLAKVTSPITVYDPGKAGVFEAMSVGQFLQLDPAEAATNGGTYTALIKTLGREGGNGTGKTNNAGAIIKNVEDLLSTLNQIASYLDTETADGKKHAAALALYMSNKKLGEDVIETIGDAVMALDAPFTRVADRYTEMKQHAAGTKTVETKTA